MEQSTSPRKKFGESQLWNGMNLSTIMSRLVRVSSDAADDDAYGRAMGAPMSEVGPMAIMHTKKALAAVLDEAGLTVAEFFDVASERISPKDRFFTFGRIFFLLDA